MLPTLGLTLGMLKSTIGATLKSNSRSKLVDFETYNMIFVWCERGGKIATKKNTHVKCNCSLAITIK
jgi:hypothetical protein